MRLSQLKHNQKQCCFTSKVSCAPAVEKAIEVPAQAAPVAPVVAVKEEPATPIAVPVPVAVVPVAKPVKVAPEQEQDASSAELRGPVASANKLLYDLEGTVQQMFEDSTNAAAAAGKEEKSIDDVVEEAQVYSAANRELDFFPRQTAGQNAQTASLVAQLENLERRLLVSWKLVFFLVMYINFLSPLNRKQSKSFKAVVVSSRALCFDRCTTRCTAFV